MSASTGEPGPSASCPACGRPPGVLAEQITAALQLPERIVRDYLGDLGDDELLERPAEGMNHIAWQLGHLIASEHFHVSQIAAGSMPPLPGDFAQRHSKETSGSDDAAAFLDKAEYLRLMAEQRSGTLAVLAGLDDEQLAAPSPESIRYLGPTAAAVFLGEATHWMMHAGQWAVVRRQLGRPPLY